MLIDINQNRRFVGIIVVQIMRSELKVPLQFSGIGIQSHDAVCIQIIARTRLSCEIGSRIACRPIHEIQLRVVSAWHPRGGATMEVCVARPTGRTGFSGRWYRPKFPSQCACFRVEGCKEAAHSTIPARSAYNNFIFDHERSAGGAITFFKIRIRDVPKHATRAPIQTQQVSVVGFHVDAVFPESHASGLVRGCVIEQAAADGTFVFP